MARFIQKKKALPMISTASLPDIVFMLLFFFMVTTQLRKENPLVNTQLPKATQVEEIQKQTPILDLYVGKPKNASLGASPRIFAEGRWIEVEELIQFLAGKIAEVPENQQNKFLVNLKVDSEVSMGFVVDVKQKLREAKALKINYQAVETNSL